MKFAFVLLGLCFGGLVVVIISDFLWHRKHPGANEQIAQAHEEQDLLEEQEREHRRKRGH
jgi:hypothetical protein